MKCLYLGQGTGEMTDSLIRATKYSHFTVAPAISTVAPAISTVAPAISKSGTGIYDRDSGFAELSATLDITSAFQLHGGDCGLI